jgi:hypothetical protein
VLLDPNDEISIEDIEALVDDVVQGSYSDPRYNKRLHEVSHLVDQFGKEKYRKVVASNDRIDLDTKERFTAVIENYKEKINNASPLLDE